jgi:outer membrane receptor protein involved in Fe transport
MTRKALALKLMCGALWSGLALAQGEITLAPVVVEASGDAEELELRALPGAGFQNPEAGVGLLGKRPIQDTPYSISVIASEVIENTQATSLNDLLKYVPSAQMEARGGLDVGRPQTRGFESSVAANNHLDGFNVSGTTAYPMELFERVEIIASLTGALYGPASPAGNFNYIAKRPTMFPLVSSPCRLKRLDFLLFDQLGWIVRFPFGTAMIPWERQERPAGFSPFIAIQAVTH